MVKFAIAALVIVASIATQPARCQTVLLDFSSPHCGPCRQMLPTIDALIAAGYPIRKVDVMREPAVAQQYQVTQVPCFIMLVDGREVDRVVGAVSGQRLQQMFPPQGRERLQSPDAMPTIPQVPVRGPSPTAAVAAPPQTPAANASFGQPNQDPWGPVGAGAPVGGGDAPTRLEVAPQDAQLIASSVRLKVEDAKGHSYGTGTIIDARSGEALIITCGHLFRDSQGKGPVTVELFEATPQGLRVVAQVPGNVVSHNLDREIGLISIRPSVPVRVAPIASTQTVMNRGDRVTSVGCNNGSDPTANNTRVTATNRYQGPPNIEAHGAPVEGRSGGGLFNTAGELVGVCFAADYEGNEGLYTALESIHDELDRLNLSDVYQKTATATGPAGQPTASLPPVVRGQEPALPVSPVGSDFGTPGLNPAMGSVSQAPAGAPAGMNQAEQAAWDEIMARAEDSEVVCIIRPKQPGGKSEIITLPSVSPGFVRGLVERAGANGSATR